MIEKKVWLITGAGRGLGVDIAKAALAAGHAVIATGRDPAKVAAAVGEANRTMALRLQSPCLAGRGIAELGSLAKLKRRSRRAVV
jgi:NAD(P)-dependent dehydrogenase (short-subunit alcohol dehydrogenase family)